MKQKIKQNHQSFIKKQAKIVKIKKKNNEKRNKINHNKGEHTYYYIFFENFLYQTKFGTRNKYLI